jgi:saccharopine dehydrogenase-like NADP-dependent oxidoreductase
MSGFENFAIAGAGEIGRFIVRQLLQDRATGKVNEVVVLTRQVGVPIVHDSGS